MLDEVNWIGGDEAINLPVRARIRSTGEPAQAELTLKAKMVWLKSCLAEAEEGVSPGQACVFYAADSDRVLGGGWISATKNSAKLIPCKNRAKLAKGFATKGAPHGVVTAPLKYRKSKS